ncbi:uncharacterized protein LOC108959741 [Eucalyptus grandis]|uniref:uncharacterized protein LOC108959741 n=1 Tax=Eucalyptus grandis TaxID=71139 RepID=UPI00192ED6FF|nr:uncharacterized protein LOC108959741 [Eucalyptus grandis]
MSKHAAVFNTDRQLTGLINDILYSATDRLSAQEKEPGDAIIKKAAFDNRNDVGEFHCEIFSGSMLKNSSQVIERQIGNLIPVQCHSAPRTCATSVGPEALPANAGSPVEVLSPGHNGVADLPLPVQSQITGCGDAMEFPVDESAPPAASQHLSANRRNAQFSQGDGGSTCFGQLIQSPDIISQEATGSQMSNPWRQTDSTTVEELALPSEPPDAPRPEGDHAMEDSQFDDADSPMDYLSILDFGTTFQTPPGMMVLFRCQQRSVMAVMQWVSSSGGEASEFVQLDGPPIQGMTGNKWEDLLDHAKTCPVNKKNYMLHDNEGDRGVISDNVGERLNDDKDLSDETSPMQEKGSSAFPSQVSEGQIQNLTPVQYNLAPGICTALANAGSTAKGHNGVALALPVQSQNNNLANALEHPVITLFISLDISSYL